MPKDEMTGAASFVKEGNRHIRYEGNQGSFEAVVERDLDTVAIKEDGSPITRRYPLKLMQYIGVMVTPDYMLKNRGPVDA
jgi:hypothetical protein